MNGRLKCYRQFGDLESKAEVPLKIPVDVQPAETSGVQDPEISKTGIMITLADQRRWLFVLPTRAERNRFLWAMNAAFGPPIPLAIVFSKASRPAGEAQGGGRGRRGSGRSAVRRSSFAVLAALGPHK